MLTVNETLQLKPFARARVVAGQAGLSRIVKWVHNVGVPDAADWLNGGELVLTTAFNMPQSIDEQKTYVQDLADKGVAGLILTTGRYIEQIPDYLCEIADELAFPLIEIPFQERFVDIAKAVNEHLSQANMRRVERALHIHQRLTELVLEGGGFTQLAEMLAELVGHSISIENERFEAIANKNIAEVDEARRYTMLHGRTNPKLVEALEDEILPQIRETLRAVHIPKMPHVGLEMERILAPVVVHGEIYGYMWIIADDHELTEIDLMAVESGATIAALMMLHQESVQSAEASLKGTLLTQLIEGDAGRETILTDQSLRYGVDLREPFLMLLLANGDAGISYMRLYRQVNQFLTHQGLQAVAGLFAGQVVILLQANQAIETILASLQERFAEQGIHIGVSRKQQGASCVGLAHEQCLAVLDIQARLSPEKMLVYFENLGYLFTLYQAGAESLQKNADVPLIRRLQDEQQADLFNTLEAYLDSGGNGAQTADNLHIHRSTLNYRLERIKQICEVDLANPATRTNLQIALKLLRLFDR